MASLIELRKEIDFNKNLGLLLGVMKAIAASQYFALERTFRSNARLFDAVQAISAMLDLEHFSHALTQSGGAIGVIAVTSDTGLLGGLNNQVIHTALEEYEQNPGALLVIGARGVSTIKERGLSCQAYPGIQDAGRGRLSSSVRDATFQLLSGGQIGALSIVYPRPLSFASQRVELIRAVPCQSWLHDESGAVIPRGGRILLESSRASVLEYLLWMWLGEKLFEVFGMSRLAELGARSGHLEGSTQALQREGKTLRQQYFRKRHELIDSSMRELFAGRMTHA